MGRPRSALRNRFEYVSYLAARWAAASLGARGTARVGDVLGAVYHRLGRRRRQILEFNLGHALPELDRVERDHLARAVARHFGRVTLDTLRLARLRPEQMLAEVQVQGSEHLEAGVARGTGVVLLSAHMGAWEVAAWVAGMRLESGLALVHRPLDNPLLDAELMRLRGRYGNRSLGKARVARSILRELSEGGAVGILLDQRVPESSGIEVPFFGHPASTHPVPARLALRTGAVAVPIWGLAEGPGRFTVRFDEPIVPGADEDEAGLTARMMASIEAIIRERPEQWLWYHDRWRQARTGAGSKEDRS